MPLQQDLGTLKGESLLDIWTNIGFTITSFANYQTLSGDFDQLDIDGPGIFKRPFYFKFKCKTDSVTPDFNISYQGGVNSYSVNIRTTQIQDGGSGPIHTVDMTIPRVVELYIPATDSEIGDVHLDGIRILDLNPSPYASTERLRMACDPTHTLDFYLYYYQVTRKPYTLIDRFWLEHLRLRVQDPEDRDDPSNFISKRYPVSSFPAEIQAPRIDFHISHRMRSKIHPASIHGHFDSTVKINFYIEVDDSIQGETNTDALNLLASNIINGLEWAMDDIPPLKNYHVSQPEYRLDGRNNVWEGNIEVNGEHLLEVF